jgi:hypothetical protein
MDRVKRVLVSGVPRVHAQAELGLKIKGEVGMSSSRDSLLAELLDGSKFRVCVLPYAGTSRVWYRSFEVHVQVRDAL